MSPHKCDFAITSNSHRLCIDLLSPFQVTVLAQSLCAPYGWGLTNLGQSECKANYPSASSETREVIPGTRGKGWGLINLCKETCSGRSRQTPRMMWREASTPYSFQQREVSTVNSQEWPWHTDCFHNFILLCLSKTEVSDLGQENYWEDDGDIRERVIYI